MREARRVALVKLGGSLITDKTGVSAVRPRRLARLARDIAAAIEGGCPRLLVGHGSGSFGHVAAVRHGFAGDEARPTPQGIAAVQRAAAELHVHVAGALRDAGVPAFSVAPSSCLVAADGRPRTLTARPVLRALERGLVPVTHGDVVMDVKRGASICSTETVLLAMVRRLRRHGVRVTGAYWFGDTDGILDEDGHTIARVEPGDGARLVGRTGGAAATDVTGGMRHRLETARTLARLGIDSWILDGARRGAVRSALAGEPDGGTRVVAVRGRGL